MGFPVSKAPTLTWGALVLLAISGFLNYFDRANLSVGASQVQSELHLTSYQLGLLLSAFFWTYALMQLFLIAGWLADRFNVCWILAAGFFLWSGATAVTGATRTFVMMF
jgi:ACS family D-galactonate transporter-like MFS transporter